MNKSTTKRLFKTILDGDAVALAEIIDAHDDAIETLGEHNRNVRDKTPLMFALQCSNFDIANYLLDRGANASAVMAGGPRFSVLGLCSKFAYCDEENYEKWHAPSTRLLDNGADPTSGLWPALHGFGGLVRRDDIVRLLLARGANADEALGNTGSTIREMVEINRSRYTDEILGLFDVPPLRPNA